MSECEFDGQAAVKVRNVALELSSKPFRSASAAAMEKVCREMFRQWRALIRHAETISVMLWTSDGSEILEYKGDLSEPFEWAKWLGVANPRYEPLPPEHPENQSIHRKPRVYTNHKPVLIFDAPECAEGPQAYTADAPVYTYGWLKRLVTTLKEIGREETGRPVTVGATFDPGPEFAVSKFKYEKHPEICSGLTMGKASFVCCYSTLNADADRYAGYPQGIPAGTPFGAFLGRQTERFAHDLGFDYLWLSNGFGFGLETWGMYGAVFDGKSFSADRCPEVREKSLVFWESFRKECPRLPLRTRGTNLTTGMDLSSDAVPLRDIYRGNFDLEPPPNSPWAALNGDFGMEIIGWMSHIAEIPGEVFPFRFYTHDPWFINSPWLDRYCRQPHDIFLPLAVGRLDDTGTVRKPTTVNILTVDDSFGQMPEEVPNEVIPHILEGFRSGPDQAGPLLWIYPFDEYHELTYGGKGIDRVFFGDWFLRSAFNVGLPLNSVISTKSFPAAREKNPAAFAQSILVSPAPAAGAVAQTLLKQVEAGGRALLYGPLDQAEPKLRELLGVDNAAPLAGEFELQTSLKLDEMRGGQSPLKIRHDALSSAGGLGEMARAGAKGVKILASAIQNGQTRIIAASAACGRGKLVWVRGTNSFTLPETKSAHHPLMLAETECFRAERLARLVLSEFGLDLRFCGQSPDAGGGMAPGRQGPMLTIHRWRNAFYFCGHGPDTTVTQSLRLPMGAPLFLDAETALADGAAEYGVTRAWRKECRIFIEQAAGLVSCRERCSGLPGVGRRYILTGLQNATVRFFPETGKEPGFWPNPNPWSPIATERLSPEKEETPFGSCLTVKNVSGQLMIYW